MTFLLVCASQIGCGASARDLKRAGSQVDLAVDALRHNQLDDAEAAARRALGFDPKDEKAENVLGLVYLKRATDADLLVDSRDCLDGAAAKDLRAEADTAMRAADRHFRRAVALAPDYGEAIQNRAAVALYFHDWDRAIHLEERALEHTDRMLPTTPPAARANLGWAYFKKGNLSRALANLLQATSQPGYFCLGESHLAQIEFARGEYEKALAAIKPMLDRRMCARFHIQDIWYLAGESYIRLHEDADAHEAFDECVRLNPKSCQGRQCDSARKAL